MCFARLLHQGLCGGDDGSLLDGHVSAFAFLAACRCRWPRGSAPAHGNAHEETRKREFIQVLRLTEVFPNTSSSPLRWKR